MAWSTSSTTQRYSGLNDFTTRREVPTFNSRRLMSVHELSGWNQDEFKSKYNRLAHRSYSVQEWHSPLPPRKRIRRVDSIIKENEKLLWKNIDTKKSNSDEEDFLISTDDNSDSSIRLEEHIKLHHLQKLLLIFKSHHPPDDNNDDDHDRQKEYSLQKQNPGMMTLQEFKTTIIGMLGTKKWEDQMEMLFHKVDTGCDGFVDWNEFCTYMLLQMREIEHIQNAKLIPFSSPAIVKQIFHNKQETTTKTMIVENPPRILTISKVGAIGVWDFDLRLLKTYSLSADVAAAQEHKTRRRCHTWVADAVYMRNTQNLALTTSSREIYFYDISTSIYTIEFCLYALPNVPICATYWYNIKSKNTHSMLFFGDDTGSIHVLHFHSPQSRLFQKPFNPKQGTQRIYFLDLRDHRQYVTYEHLGNIHSDVVRRIMYVRDNDVIISSSMSSSSSVVFMDYQRKKKPYIFKISKGVECFDYSKSLNILVTGSLDHLVRIWNPYVVAKPIIILTGHNTGICDVRINEAYGQIVTYSKDVVIKVWDIREQSCLQTILPKFASIQPGRIPDHGEFPLSLHGSPHNLLLATCNDSVAALKMGKLEPKAETPTTHNAPLCGVLYNHLFRQVVTASDDSTVSVWDVENGSRSLTFTNAHGQEEITCLAFDKSSRRLFTGARDGSIKVWNFQNGNCLHELEAVDEAEVTGVLPFQDRTILAVGWSRLITTYDDSDPDVVNISARRTWKGGQLHQDDILAVAHGHPNFLATGSYDGCIIVWNEETQQEYVTLRDGSKGRKKEANRPVDVVIFLQERSRGTKKNLATLLSSESGTIFWWCLLGRKSLLGYFFAAQAADESVLAISSSSDDNYLITGDTIGYVTVWNIQDYCITDQLNHVITESPPVVYRWKAHDKAITSVEYIDHDLQAMVVTASSDKTARLWTLEGRLVGTFGQPKKWNLKQSASYQYPMDPWGEIVEREEPGHAYKKQNLTTETVLKSTEPRSKLKARVDANPEDIDADEIITNEEELDGNTQETSETENDKINHDETIQEDSSVVNKEEDVETIVSDNGSVVEVLEINIEKVETDDTQLEESEDNDDLHGGISQPLDKSSSNKKILGLQAEEILSQRTVTRQQRRQRVGHIDETSTFRFGNICSPFQALAIRDTEAVLFDPGMPMTKRMKERGMHCSNEAELFKMPLSSLFEFNEQVNTKSQKQRQTFPHRRNTLLPPIASSSASTSASQSASS